MIVPSIPTDNLYKLVAVGGLVILIVSVVLPVQIWLEVRQQCLTLEKPLHIALDTKADLDFVPLARAILVDSDPAPDAESVYEVKDLLARLKQDDDFILSVTNANTSRTPFYTRDENQQKKLFTVLRDQVSVCYIVILNYRPALMKEIIAGKNHEVLYRAHLLTQKELAALTDDQIMKYVKEEIELHRKYRTIFDEGILAAVQFWNALDYLNTAIWCGIGGAAFGLVTTAIGFRLWYVKVQRYVDRDLAKGEQPSHKQSNKGHS